MNFMVTNQGIYKYMNFMVTNNFQFAVSAIYWYFVNIKRLLFFTCIIEAKY